MCGRFVSTQSRYALSERFGVARTVGEALPPSYNVAPSRLVYAVAGTREGRRLGTMRWGLVPSWSQQPERGPRPINARVETITTSNLFAPALARRRCIVPADGYYEWRRGPATRQPFLFSAPDGSPLAMAALWDRWTGPDGEQLVTCAVITTPANALVAPFHDRMPALLDDASLSLWLDPARTDAEALAGLLMAAPDDALTVREVDRLVNNAANDGPELLRSPG